MGSPGFFSSDPSKLLLSPREQDVLAFLVCGRSPKKAGALLKISHRTVETHIRTILLKTGCHSRETLLEHIQRAGLTPFFRARHDALHQGITPPDEEQSGRLAVLRFPAEHFPFQDKKLKVMMFSTAAVLLCGTVLTLPVWTHQAEGQSRTLRSDLMLPAEETLLPRPGLMDQMNQILASQAPTIRIVAITGIGGSGKTTLARQYVRKQKASVAWEINAETPESLLSSFENLAEALAVRTEDRSLFFHLRDIRNPGERTERMLAFVREHLQGRPGWILLFDNIASGTDLDRILPHTAEAWGAGRVILTTRDAHIQNSRLVHGTLTLGELTPEEASTLFLGFLGHGRPHLFSGPEDTEAQARAFVKCIPPFPLDLSLAAHYIRSTRSSWAQAQALLEHRTPPLLSGGKGQPAVQGRRDIIRASLHSILAQEPGALSLLACISRVDSQGIPVFFLDQLDQPERVKRLLALMESSSLMRWDAGENQAEKASFSLHRSTQEIIRSLLPEFSPSLDLTPLAERMARAGARFMEQKDVPSLKRVIPHYRAWLNHSPSDGEEARALIQIALGSMLHASENYHQEAIRPLLEKGLASLEPFASRHQGVIARGLSCYGDVLFEFGHLQEALAVLQKSLAMTSAHTPCSRAQALYHAGIVLRDMSQYQKADALFSEAWDLCEQHNLPVATRSSVLRMRALVCQDKGEPGEALVLLKESLRLVEHFPGLHVKQARTLRRLGWFYLDAGQYEEAEKWLDKALKVYEKHQEGLFILPDILTLKGEVFKAQGQYDKARTFIEQAVSTSEQYFPDNERYRAWMLSLLGGVLKRQGLLSQACEVLLKSLDLHKKHYEVTHTEYGWMMASLGALYHEAGDLEKARDHLEQGYAVHTRNMPEGHPYRGWSAAHLGAVYGDLGFFGKARPLLEQGLAIYRRHYGPEHLKTAGVMRMLGDLERHEGHLEKSCQILSHASEIFRKHRHPDVYRCFESLADLGFARAGVQTASPLARRNDLRISIRYIEQAQRMAEKSLPAESAHIVRLKKKQETLRQTLGAMAS